MLPDGETPCRGQDARNGATDTTVRDSHGAGNATTIPRDEFGRPLVTMPLREGNAPTNCPFGCPINATARNRMSTSI